VVQEPTVRQAVVETFGSSISALLATVWDVMRLDDISESEETAYVRVHFRCLARLYYDQHLWSNERAMKGVSGPHVADLSLCRFAVPYAERIDEQMLQVN
jgi:hypothetical protein